MASWLREEWNYCTTFKMLICNWSWPGPHNQITNRSFSHDVTMAMLVYQKNPVRIGQFRVASSLSFKARLTAKLLIWKWFFILMHTKLIFTRKLLHLALVFGTRKWPISRNWHSHWTREWKRSIGQEQNKDTRKQR